MAAQIQIRRDTSADWTSVNPILAQGEQGLELDTGKFKFGDGATAWNSLPYAFSGFVPYVGPGPTYAFVYGMAQANSAAANTTAYNAALAAAIAAGGGCVVLPAGNYAINATSVNTAYGVSLKGQGKDVTFLNMTGAGNCVDFHPTPWAGSGTTVETACQIDGMTIDGQAATGTASGLHFGDFIGGRIWDVKVRNFSGASMVGFWGDNIVGNTERLNMIAESGNNTVLYKFDRNSGGSGTSAAQGSFDYGFYQLSGQAAANQIGIQMFNGAQMDGGYLEVTGNYGTGTTNTGSVFQITGASGGFTSRITGCIVLVGVECDGSSGVGHQTINFGTTSNTFIGCTGYMKFLNITESFTASNQIGQANQFSLNGPVVGDTTLSSGPAATNVRSVTTTSTTKPSDQVIIAQASGSTLVITLNPTPNFAEITIMSIQQSTALTQVIASNGFSGTGTVVVQTNNGAGTATITFTGVSGNTLTGCTTTSGSGLLYNGATVTQTVGSSTNAGSQVAQASSGTDVATFAGSGVLSIQAHNSGSLPGGTITLAPGAAVTLLYNGITSSYEPKGNGAGIDGTNATTPPTSGSIQTALGNLVLGTAFQNTLPYDVRMTVNLAITSNTSLVVGDGVGPTSTPTQTTTVNGTTALGIVPVTCKIPAGYFRLLSEVGTGTIAIVGQYLEAS